MHSVTSKMGEGVKRMLKHQVKALLQDSVTNFLGELGIVVFLF
jgi:hypothetical protein